MESGSDHDDLIFEQVFEPGGPIRRIGRSKITGKVLVEMKLDEQGREMEKRFFSDNGELTKIIVYEHDQERRPRLISVFDKDGKLIWRQERGKRPESCQ